MKPPREHDLDRHRQELLAKLDAIAADYRRGLDRDSEERAVELENADVLAEIERVTREQLRDVEARIARRNASDDDTG